MPLSLEPNPPVRRKKCPNCKSKYLDIRHFVLKDNNAYAIAFIECHRHNQEPEIFFTVIFGSWDDTKTIDHITFDCRYGKVINSDGMACTLIDVPDFFTSSLAGKKLSRAEALEHPRLNEFWQVVDFLLETDKTIHDWLYHPTKSFLGRLKLG